MDHVRSEEESVSQLVNQLQPCVSNETRTLDHQPRFGWLESLLPEEPQDWHGNAPLLIYEYARGSGPQCLATTLIAALDSPSFQNTSLESTACHVVLAANKQAPVA